MSFEIEELKLLENEDIEQVIEYIMIILNKSEKIKINANRNCSVIASKASERLIELGYVKYDNIQTRTDIENDGRIIKLVITLKKTNKFINIIKENIKNIITGEIELKKLKKLEE